MLIQTGSKEQLADVLIKLQPGSDQYWRLQKALRLYRSLQAEEQNLTVINLSEKIKPGQKHSAIPGIRRRLLLTEPGLANKSNVMIDDSLKYDSDLVFAVKHFQITHGLPGDGVIGGKTFSYLSQSFKQKADLIALNMERLRWSAQDYGHHYIAVNIPEFKLRIFEEGKQTLEMKVIVGSIQTPTPIFQDSLERIVFSPTWTVPPSIMKAEIFPRLKKDSAYYSARNYSFYKNGKLIDPASESWDKARENAHEYRVVQKPGADNALGLVKFVMPNDMNIYLHDTPDHTPFSKSYRALSHGCIRLDDPAGFAAYLLQNENEWNAQQISKAMNASTPTVVQLKKTYPVHLEYNTVWVDNDGSVNFREDLYGHDSRQIAQLINEKKFMDSLVQNN
jgi:L,D-transpeptidase YcbB